MAWHGMAWHAQLHAFEGKGKGKRQRFVFLAARMGSAFFSSFPLLFRGTPNTSTAHFFTLIALKRNLNKAALALLTKLNSLILLAHPNPHKEHISPPDFILRRTH